MRKRIKQIVLTAAVLLAADVFASPEIRVDGLFKDKAVLTINGRMRVLKIGETSPEGVRLISSDSKKAELEVERERLTLGISEHISSNFVAPSKKEVRIPRGQGGHYFVGGFINGHRVEYMLDTGATKIAMSGNQAKQLNIDLRSAKRGGVSTANGVVEGAVVTLDKVTVGSITLRSVPITVIAGDFPAQILLGNSFLSRVEMNEVEGVMVLREKY